MITYEQIILKISNGEYITKEQFKQDCMDYAKVKNTSALELAFETARNVSGTKTLYSMFLIFDEIVSICKLYESY